MHDNEALHNKPTSNKKVIFTDSNTTKKRELSSDDNNNNSYKIINTYNKRTKTNNPRLNKIVQNIIGIRKQTAHTVSPLHAELPLHITLLQTGTCVK